jgi:hypothetical protein
MSASIGVVPLGELPDSCLQHSQLTLTHGALVRLIDALYLIFKSNPFAQLPWTTP